MKAIKKITDVVKERIVLTPENYEKLSERFSIDVITIKKYLQLTEAVNTAPKRNDVLMAAVNEYDGWKEETRTRKEIVEIIADDNK